MPSRIEYKKVAPGAYRAMLGLETYIHDCDLETSLLDLIRMRASQINGWNRLNTGFRTEAGAYQPGKIAEM